MQVLFPYTSQENGKNIRKLNTEMNRKGKGIMKIGTKVLAVIVVVFLSLYTPVSGYIDHSIKVTLNGVFVGSEAKMIDGQIYVPLKVTAEALDSQINWDEKSNIVNISKKGNDEIIPEVIKSVSPSVVGIIGNWKENDRQAYRNKYSEEIIHGTGVIIKSNGEILTNTHVIKPMDKIVVVLADGNGYEGKLKYMDEESDLAVIKIEKNGLQTAQFGIEEDIIIGKTVIAIGTPINFSLRNSASIGIISGVNRNINSFYKLIQTDAAINPGNSGGPLVNLEGKVVGINSSKFYGTGIEGMGFTIPIGTVNYVINQFDQFGTVKRPYLGAEFEEDWAAKIGLPSNNGLTMKRIEEKSPAKTYDLRVGDILLAVNDNAINSVIDFNEEMKKYAPTNQVTMKIKRDGAIQRVNVILGSK